MDYLAKDLAHIAVPLLRAACDRAAQSARGMPYASEILACAATIVEERQRAADPVQAQPFATVERDLDKLAVVARAYNRENAGAGNLMRWTDTMQPFRIGDPGEKRFTNSNGAVI